MLLGMIAFVAIYMFGLILGSNQGIRMIMSIIAPEYTGLKEFIRDIRGN